MNHLALRIEFALSAAVVAAFAVFYTVAVAADDPPEFPSQYVLFALAVAIFATPCVVVVRLLWRAWWVRYGADRDGMDTPALLLTVAVATLPDDRADWGRAMQVELSHVPDSGARWSFATGCALTAAFPPRTSRMPVVIAGVLAAAAVVTAGRAVGHALPALVVFTVTFLALVGGMVTLTVARSHRAIRTFSSQIITITGLVSVAASITSVAAFLVAHPTAAANFPSPAALTLAVVLAVTFSLAVSPPRSLTSNRPAVGLGIGAALLFTLGFVVTSRVSVNTTGGPMIWIMTTPIVIPFVFSAASTAVRRSFGDGLQTAVWASLIGTLLVFTGWLPEATYRFSIDRSLLLDGEGGVLVGENLSDAIWIIIIVPILSLPFGVIGASFGATGSLQEIGITTPRSPGIASLLLSLPFAVLFTIAINDLEPFKTWFSQGHPLHPLGQLLMMGSFACLLLACLFALISLYRRLSFIASLVRQSSP